MTVDTIAGAFLATVKAIPDTIYCKRPDISLACGQAAGAIQTLADELRVDVQGKTAALILPNSAACLAAYLAALFAGAKPPLINLGCPETKIQKLLGDLDAAVVLSDKTHAGPPIRILNETNVQGLVRPVDLTTLTDSGTTNNNAAIMHSGGTAGLPKHLLHEARADDPDLLGK